jgi:UDP-GlcNAc:undecaprenyl-phosphate GlcNAc-1-phosphate transferase
MLVPVLLMALGAFTLSLALTIAAREFGRRRVLLDSQGVPGQDKARREVPNIGGVAIFWSIALPVLAGLAAVWFFPGAALRIAPAAAAHLPGIREQTPMALGVLGAMLALHIAGLIDDRRPIGPLPKFVLMIGCAAGVVLVFDVRLLTLLDAHAGGPWLSVLLTILWIVAVTNAMNFMDNTDGLAAGVGAVASTPGRSRASWSSTRRRRRGARPPSSWATAGRW